MRTKEVTRNWKRAGAPGKLTLVLLSPVMLAFLLMELRADAVALETVHLALPSRSFQMAIFPLAQERGYMREEGIDLRPILIRPVTSIQAMLSGDIQFTMAGTSALVAATRGVPVKVILAVNDQVLQWVLSKQEISSPRSLKGKRIATSGLAAAATFMTKQVLAKHGLDPGRDAIYIEMRSSAERLQALIAGAVDAAILGVEERYRAPEADLRELIYIGSEVRNSWGTLATTDKMIREKPKIVGSFIRASLKALRLIRQERDAAVSMMVQFSGLGRPVASRVYHDLIGTFSRDGTVDEETQKNDLAIIRQVTGATGTIAISQAYDFRFAREADRQLTQAGWRP